MPMSRYPRSGHRLAPAALQNLLNAPVPRRLLPTEHPVRFADLDEGAWKTFGPEVCRKLANALVERIRAELSPLPEALRSQLLPQLPENVRVDDLELEPRTYNCLRKMQLLGLLRDAQDLRGKTIGQMLAIGGFGAKSLVDLLSSMEAVLAAEHLGTAPQGASAVPVARETEWESMKGSGTPLSVSLAALRTLRLPKMPEGVSLSDLKLEGRTRNCLERNGFHERLHELEECTVEDFLARPGLGVQCLSDLLRSIHAYHHGGVQEPSPSDEFPAFPELFKEEHATLEDELRSLVARALRVRRASPHDRNTGIVVQHLGFDGAGGATLKAVGDANGLTRERVRQIFLRVKRSVKGKGSATPLIDKALGAITQLLPAEAGAVEAKLQEGGFTQSKFRLEGLANAVKLLGRKVPFELEVIDARRMVFHPKRGRMARQTIQIAQRAIAHFGVATASDIAALVQERMSCPVTPEFVTAILEGRTGFVWLDSEAGWFWLRSPNKNRVLSRIRKILAVAESIDVSELRSGVGRHHAMKGYAPPRRVLLELCRHLPYCRVEGAYVRAEPVIDWQQVLRGTEHTMVQVLKEYGPVMQRAKFEDACLARGMNRSTFYAYLADLSHAFMNRRTPIAAPSSC
jgi:hypothetical protein